MLESFGMQKEEFLDQAINEIKTVEEPPQTRPNKFLAIENGINTLQNKLNEFNNFNRNPKRIAELRKYCATSITHTTKTISGGISSRLLKSGSNSGGQSKNKTTTRHFQSTSNLDQNSLITVGNGQLPATDFLKDSSASNQRKNEDGPLREASLHDAMLSNILENTQVQPLTLNHKILKIDDDEEMNELEGLMNGWRSSEEKNQAPVKDSYFLFEKELQQLQNKNKQQVVEKAEEQKRPRMKIQKISLGIR